MMPSKLCFDIALFYRRMRFLWICGDTRPATICVILSGYLWAVLLLLPGSTITRPTYRHMREMLPTDEAWAAAFIVVATLQLWRLFSLTTERSKWADLFLKIVACGLYTFVSIACLTSLWPIPAAMADNVVISIAAAWDLLRFDVRRGCGANHYPSGACPYDGGKNGGGT
jgi:hypothetical protein